MRFKIRWKLYEYISKNPNQLLIKITKDMKWSRRKTIRHLKRLTKDNLIRLDYKNVGYIATPMKELINWDEF